MIDLSIKKNLKSDLPAGLVVFLVALPLCLGIASASGAGPGSYSLFSGLIAGIVGGLVVGALSGSAIGASGPAAGLATIVYNSVEDLGYSTFLVAVVIAGAFQLIMGYVRAGAIAYYFPVSVIKGMLAGIGITLILKQIPHALGTDKDTEGDTSFVQSDGENTFTEIINACTNAYDALVNSINTATLGAIIISMLCLAIILLWTKYVKSLSGFFKLIPGALVAIVIGSSLNEFFLSSYPALAVSGDHLVKIPVFTSFESFEANMTFPNWNTITSGGVWITAATIALVASLETLLCVEATDKLDPHKRITPANRELKAQGVGNIVSGLLGGLPITQVIVRSSANVAAGGQTKMSTIFHGFLLLVSVIAFPMVMNKIPLAALAAILLVVGYKLARVSIFKEMFARGIEQWLPFVITILGILLINLLVGIGIGLVLAIFFILIRNLKTDHISTKEEADGSHIHTIVLSEEVSFLNKGALQNALEHVKPNETVIIDANKSVRIPYDIYDLVKEFESTAHERDIKVELKHFDESLLG